MTKLNQLVSWDGSYVHFSVSKWVDGASARHDLLLAINPISIDTNRLGLQQICDCDLVPSRSYVRVSVRVCIEGIEATTVGKHTNATHKHLNTKYNIVQCAFSAGHNVFVTYFNRSRCFVWTQNMRNWYNVAVSVWLCVRAVRRALDEKLNIVGRALHNSTVACVCVCLCLGERLNEECVGVCKCIVQQFNRMKGHKSDAFLSNCLQCLFMWENVCVCVCSHWFIPFNQQWHNKWIKLFFDF